ncbi:MAG: GGDEF domain-containing protein [Cereibacter sphaeroides]|uniref:GGDEF domain-containing protein n=1 Tax=Cereibacter sphaeroides TaxID=1063 RepID=A0A2W5SLK3_CERSP|nr:MAG: GGDEF domain-containing protein [Cereibacter sphaeroides]
MDGGMPRRAITIATQDLARLMPMYLGLAADGMITHCGPTIAKLVGMEAVGLPFFSLFEVRRPDGIADMDAMVARAGDRLHLNLRDAPGATLRGIAVQLPDGVLLNLSFGISVADAVRAHQLTDADFAPTDLAMELLYLDEAKTAVMNELRELNRRLEGARSAAVEEALTDTLTGLHNRRGMYAALSQLSLRAMPFGLMAMDLDFFKAVNDTLGHAAGDHVLREVARILRAQTRVGDTVARVGGDEFVILLPGLVEAEVMRSIAGRIIAQIAQPVLFEGRECQVSASIGMAVSEGQGGLSPDGLLEAADQALYFAKGSGRGRAMFGVGG